MAKPLILLSVDVEEWFHILDTDITPDISQWDNLESRVEANMEKLLSLFAEHDIKATFFWLGWMAERYTALLRRCLEEGHEIASHGYAHLLPYKVGREKFRQDIKRAKKILEDLSGKPVEGFRAPGFGITAETSWAFEEILEAGYRYDSSIFPAARGHGGIPGERLGPFLMKLKRGVLLEIPVSVNEVAGRRMCLTGGGYFRITPRFILHRAICSIASRGLPVVIYLHPRDIDPGQPRLPLPLTRKIKSYVGLNKSFVKLRDTCKLGTFLPMGEYAAHLEQFA